MNKFICTICKKESKGYGNNPSPICSVGKCCDKCNNNLVIPVRIFNIIKGKGE